MPAAEVALPPDRHIYSQADFPATAPALSSLSDCRIEIGHKIGHDIRTIREGQVRHEDIFYRHLPAHKGPDGAPLIWHFRSQAPKGFSSASG